MHPEMETPRIEQVKTRHEIESPFCDTEHA